MAKKRRKSKKSRQRESYRPSPQDFQSVLPRDTFNRRLAVFNNAKDVYNELDRRRPEYFEPRHVRGRLKDRRAKISLSQKTLKNRPYKRLTNRLRFHSPWSVNICRKRRRRRRVLFALNLAGRGKGSRRPRKLTRYSQVRC
jgi:hypothetical protein